MPQAQSKARAQVEIHRKSGGWPGPGSRVPQPRRFRCSPGAAPPGAIPAPGYAAGMEQPSAIRPQEHAVFRSDKMGKATLFSSERILVGLNCFEGGQEHALHAHGGMDKVYYVLQGEGLFLLEGRELPMSPGVMLVAPQGVPHGIRNAGAARLVVLAILAPGP